MTTILLIEDAQSIRDNTEEILTIAGYRVLTAENGRQGLSIARQERPDLILCDILMPLLTGYEVFNALKVSGKHKIPFVFVTGSAEEKEIQEALAMGADGYIIKPFDGDELLQVIQDVLIRAGRITVS